MEQSIMIEDVSFGYKKDMVLSHINLELKGNCLACMIGNNGVGKTTLFKLIAGDMIPVEGKILVDGVSPEASVEIKRNIILSDADTKFPRNLKLSEIMSYFQESYENFDETFARKLFELFHINEKKAFKEHSLGFQSIVKFIFALSARAPITLLDEPVIGMDLGARRKAYKILLREYIEHPRMIIVSSHMLNEMEEIVDYLILIQDQKIKTACEVDKLSNLMFRIDGDASQLKEIATGQKIIRSTYSNLVNYIIVQTEDESFLNKVAQTGLSVSRLSLSDICMYQLNDYEEEGMDALWEE
ncbi:ABC transporter, ATP-binding protein [Lachnospiraceae bacterium KM106-2]|nr:ABC transporter, ATP-binding protein [Lachnospiraceae bacterium KM106-2]